MQNDGGTKHKQELLELLRLMRYNVFVDYGAVYRGSPEESGCGRLAGSLRFMWKRCNAFQADFWGAVLRVIIYYYYFCFYLMWICVYLIL